MKKVLLALPLLLLTACDNVVRKSPLDWCLWEIHKHEHYDCERYSYAAQDVYERNVEHEKNSLSYSYYITYFADDRVGYWYCGIVVEHKSFLDRAAGRKVYSWEEVNQIDCDLIREELE